MAKKKVCKLCKSFVEGTKCPLCKASSFTNNWQGKITITDVKKSEIAKKIEIKPEPKKAEIVHEEGLKEETRVP